MKVLLLTATPMKNLADDIVELLNFMRPKNIPIERDKIFSYHKNYEMKILPDGLSYLNKMARGYVSYYKGVDPLVYASRKDEGEIPEGLQFTPIIPCKMDQFQYEIYKMNELNETGDTLDKKSSSICNFVFPGLSEDMKSVIGYYGKTNMNIVKLQIKMNSESLNTKIATEILHKPYSPGTFTDSYIKLTSDEKTITGLIMKLENLKYFSIKFYTALININKLFYGNKGASTAFIYSNLVKIGIELFEQVLLQNGYLLFQENNMYTINDDTICYYCGINYKDHQQTCEKKLIPNHEYYPATFISITGKSSEEEDIETFQEDKQNQITNIFNDIENKEGKYIKLVLGSRVMNEGISLKNIREVHILDVYYNFGRIEQVIGRAIRFCSHYKLMNKDNKYPVVSVFKYAIVIDNSISTEIELYRKAELKYLLVKKIEMELKKIAIDCPLNIAKNISYNNSPRGNLQGDNNDVTNGTKNKKISLCDYTDCNYVCDDDKLNEEYLDKTNVSTITKYKDVNKDDIDYSTYTNILTRGEIEMVKKIIKEMYIFKYIYVLDEIVDYVKRAFLPNLVNDFFIYKALDELIPTTSNDYNNFNDIIINKYGVSGYLIYIKNYYIFQPIDKNKNTPIEDRIIYNKNIAQRITLYNYIKMIAKDVVIENNVLNNKENEVNGYDFNSVMEYYESRDEFNYVGIIDKEKNVKNTKNFQELNDIFKIRVKREKILDKKRGTGISSFKGADCSISKNKKYLYNIAKKIGIPNISNISRNNICSLIKDRLLFLEKYGSDKSKLKIPKLTYIIIPNNHPIYPFPYNLEDRVDYIISNINLILGTTQDESDVYNIHITYDKENLPIYSIEFINLSPSDLLKLSSFNLNKIKNKYIITIS